jgi:hypothetical protein
MREMRNAYKILVVQFEGKRIWKYRHRWEDNIRLYIREMKWEVMG